MKLHQINKNEDILFNKILLYFDYSPFLLIRPFLSDLAVSISAILFIINSIKNKLFKFQKLFLYFFNFLLYIIFKVYKQ